MKSRIAALFALMIVAAVSTLSAQCPSPGDQPEGIAFDGANLWVANYGHIDIGPPNACTPTWVDGNTVTEIRASDGALLRTVTVGDSPYGVAFDGTNVWVTNEFSNSVTKIQASTGTVIGTYAVGQSPAGIVFDGTNIWTANFYDGTVTELLASTGATVATYDAGIGMCTIVGIAYDGANIWVTESRYGHGTRVVKMSASSGAVLGTFSVGTYLKEAVYDGAGSMWVTGAGNTATVVKVRVSDGTVLGSFSLGSSVNANAEGIVFDGTSIWAVVNTGFNSTNEVDLVNLRVSDGAELSRTTVTGGSCPWGASSSPSAAGLAYDGSHFWVSYLTGCVVTKI